MADLWLIMGRRKQIVPKKSDNLEDQDTVDMSQFCCAYKDRAILEDSRVLRNMLELEEFYIPSPHLYEEIQDEIRIHMRKIVTEWMLDVCLDSR